MKINKDILETRLQNKFQNLTLHSIINESFLNSLIFHDDLSPRETRELSMYSKKVFESLGGFSILESALLSEKDPNKLKLLANLHNICTEAASKAAKAHEVENKEDSLPEIVDKAAFTEKEISEFSKDAESVDIEHISEVIKEKVIQVIKDEKEELERNEEIEAELEEMLNDGNEEAENKEEVIESFYNIALDKSYVRKPISLFSKLLDVSMENLMNVKHSGDRLDTNIIEKITLENTFPIFNHKVNLLDKVEMACESLLPDDGDRDISEISENATVSTIIIFSLLETLNTYNLISFNKDMVREFLDKPVSFSNGIKRDIKDTLTVIRKDINEVDSHNCNSSSEIKNTIETFNRYTKILEKSLPIHSENGDVIEELIGDIEAKKNLLTLKLDEVKREENNNEPVKLNSFQEAQKDLFKIELDKVARNIVTKPFVDEVRILHDPEVSSPEYVNVDIRGVNGQESMMTTIPLNYRKEFGSVVGFITESFKSSKLSEVGKSKVFIYNTISGERKEL